MILCSTPEGSNDRCRSLPAIRIWIQCAEQSTKRSLSLPNLSLRSWVYQNRSSNNPTLLPRWKITLTFRKSSLVLHKLDNCNSMSIYHTYFFSYNLLKVLKQFRRLDFLICWWFVFIKLLNVAISPFSRYYALTFWIYHIGNVTATSPCHKKTSTNRTFEVFYVAISNYQSTSQGKPFTLSSYFIASEIIFQISMGFWNLSTAGWCKLN